MTEIVPDVASVVAETGKPRLHIAWLGPVPAQKGGVPEVATQLLAGLGDLGHRVDCFMPAGVSDIPETLEKHSNLTFIWSRLGWRWNRWYSRDPLAAFATGLASRGRAFMRLRRTIAHRHARDPFDVIYQFSNIETVAVSKAMAKAVPLVIHPQTHSAGELRWLLAERGLARRCQPWTRSATTAAVFALRTVVQRVTIKRARLLVCISSAFRDHIVRDYGFPREATVVIPSPVELSRFDPAHGAVDSSNKPRTALVVGRIALRKGVEQIVDLSQILARRGAAVHLRVVGGHSLWSDYRPLLRDLDAQTATYVGPVAADAIPKELLNADMLIQASKYEPFGLTVAEALAAGVPVIATSEVGAVEGTSGLSTVSVPVGDADALADGVEEMSKRLEEDLGGVRQAARADAERLFSPQTVCQQISDELEALVASNRR